MRKYVLSLALLLGGTLSQAEEALFDFPVGLDAQWKEITARVTKEALDPNRDSIGVLVVSENPPSSFQHSRASISWAPVSKSATFPPEEKAYVSTEQYLWRWILMLAPDAIVTDNKSLAKALKDKVPCFGLVEEVPDSIGPSLLRIQSRKLAARSSLEIAESISNHYGHQLEGISYIPALAMVGRSRLAKLKGEDIADELISIAEKTPVPKTISGAAVSGHLIFAELGLKDRVIAAAESALKTPGHNEMSDSVFMICPLLAAAGRLSGDEKYFRACAEHLDRMQRFCLRDDGLYRHSPLDEAAWGRGNGFPALGLAWALSEMPNSFSGRKKILAAYRSHIAALAPFQDASGMWHQVIDHSGSYREFTCTCMITFAILRGMRSGWLERERFEPIADLGWAAVKLRISPDGKSFTDACTGTGKQKSLNDYFRRTAILGPDDRSGAMALMVATEWAHWKKEK